jgi:ribose transport system substrate-binding protein
MKRPWMSGTMAASFAAALTLALGAPQPAAAKDPVIRNVFKFPNGWWPTKIQQEVQEQAKQLGVDYQITGPQGGDVAKQVDMIEGFVSDKVDVLIVSSLGPASCQAVDDAVRDGIKVVMADSDCPQSKRIAFFGSKDAGLGGDAATLFNEATKGKGPQKILVVTGTPGAENLAERERGFKDKLKELGVQAHYLPTIPCYEDTQKAVDAIESALRGDPSITGIYVTAFWPFEADAKNFPLMTKAVQDGKLTVVNVDAFSGGLKMVEQGYIYGEVSQNLGQLVIGPLNFAYQIGLKGVKYPSICKLGSQVVTKDGGPGRFKAAEFLKKYWVDFDWDLHTLSPADCVS